MIPPGTVKYIRFTFACLREFNDRVPPDFSPNFLRSFHLCVAAVVFGRLRERHTSSAPPRRPLGSRPRFTHKLSVSMSGKAPAGPLEQHHHNDSRFKDVTSCFICIDREESHDNNGNTAAFGEE